MPAAARKAPIADLPRRLLAWYDRHARVLPWRAPPNSPERADPYRIWLSEIMLQQTTVATVGPYFRDFLARWPTVADLAAAPLEAVLGAWAGLGYYARARNLHRCARVVVERHGGHFPQDLAALLELPGIGPYTAAAIAAIAFGQAVVPVDGNVERVVARLFAIADRPPAAKPQLRRAAQRLAAGERAGDFAQALMDLGATICTPRNAQCLLCPWQDACTARRRGAVERFPARAEKAARPVRHGVAYVLMRPARGRAGDVWVRRRPPTGLLGGMLEVPSTPWRAEAPSAADAAAHAPGAAEWRPIPGEIRHVFTHFELRLVVWRARAGRSAPGGGTWIDIDEVATAGLPTVMKKILAHARINPGLTR